MYMKSLRRFSLLFILFMLMILIIWRNIDEYKKIEILLFFDKTFKEQRGKNHPVTVFNNLYKYKIHSIHILFDDRINNKIYRININEKKIIDKIILTLKQSFETRNFSGHYKNVYLLTLLGDNNFKYSFIFYKKTTDSGSSETFKDIYGNEYDNELNDISQISIIEDPSIDANNEIDPICCSRIAVFRCQGLIPLFEKYIDEEVRKSGK